MPASFAQEVVAGIDARLTGIVRDHDVRLLWAVESGSRAWGFPSPDSDYDCRFLYTRKLNDYLSPWAYRDVIETPLDTVYDVNGWDLAKALQLVAKGNAAVIEWLRSPVVYQGDDEFRDAMLGFAGRFADRAAIGRHYLHLGLRQRKLMARDDSSISLKRLFYVIRPALALRWLRQHPAKTVMPMDMSGLLATTDVPVAIRKQLGELLARKADTRELGQAAMPQPLGTFLDKVFAAARHRFPESVPSPTPDMIREGTHLLRRFAVDHSSSD